MNPRVGLQDPSSPNMSWQQGPSLLTGFAPPQTAMLQPPSGLLSSMGPWSQMAYNMAGSPVQGPYQPIAPPAAIPGSLGSGSTGGSTGSTAGALAGGLLGAVAKNPALIKSIGNGISGLLGGSGSSVLAGGTPALSPVGVGPISELPSVTSAVNAGAADAGASATPSAAGGLLGAGAASSAGSALGAGAPGVFATGNAAAGSAGASSSLSGAGAAAAAAPFAILAAYGLSKGLASQKENDQGNDLVNAWLRDSGSTTHVVNPPTPQQASAVAQGGLAGAGSGYHPQSVVYDKSGQPMSNAQVELAMQQYAQAHGMATGNFTMTPTQLQQIINSGGYGSQVYGTPGYPKPVGFGG